MATGTKAAGNGRRVNRTSKWITPEKRAAVYLRDGFRCVYCGELPAGVAYRTHPTAIALGLHVDHVIPRSHGGTNDAKNLVTSCDTCNRSKSDRVLADWLEHSIRGQRLARGELAGRLAAAVAKPLDLHAGKQHVGERAARPLPEHQRAPRARSVGAPF